MNRTLKRYSKFLLLSGLLAVLAAPLDLEASIEGFDHSAWNALLIRHVRPLQQGRATQVDYAGMQADAEALAQYLDATAAVDQDQFLAWPASEQLAFLINVYNARTVELVLTEYPAIDSIRDIGSLFRSPWRRNFVPLFGDMVSLDEIEHGMIREPGVYDEPRIHFAVNCAAIGCPALRAEAYTGSRLSEQLDDATRKFLADRDRNYFEGSSLRVSRIFDWYEEDFVRNWQGVNSVAEFLTRYAQALELDEQQVRSLRAGDIRIRYLRYDWGLNAVH